MMNYSVSISTLEQLDTDEVERSAFLIVYLCLITVIGMTGNILVCVIYRHSYTTSMSKYFIFWLAVNDTINSFVTILELISVSHPYTYPSEWLCKMTIFLEMWPTLTSGTLLCVIGIDRYRKVCHPFGWQIRQNHARNIYIVIILAALLFSWPTLVFFGKRDITLSPYNVTGQACLFRKEHDGTLHKTLYSGLLWIIFVTALVLLVIFYCLIGKKIVFQMKRGDELNTARSLKSISRITPDTTSIEFNQTGCGTNVKHDSIVTDSLQKKRTSIVSSVSTKKSQRMASARRSAYIMFLISLVFVVSFVPYLTLRLIEALDEDFVRSLSGGETIVYNFFLRCYFLNCAVNPLIYGACVAQFRNDVKALFRRVLNRN